MAIDLTKFAREHIQEIMLKKTASRTKEEQQIYSRVKLENWVARKDGKAEPWQFETLRKAKGMKEPAVATETPITEEFSTPEADEDEDDTSHFSGSEEELVSSEPEKSSSEDDGEEINSFFRPVGPKIVPNWQTSEIPEQIDFSELIGKRILCFVDDSYKSYICVVRQEGEMLKVVSIDGSINKPVNPIDAYRALHFGSIIGI